jgi:hypothetical protein
VQSAWPVELPSGKVPLAVWSYSEADDVLVASTVASTAQFNSSNTYAWDISTMPATATTVGSYKSLDRAEQDGDLKLEAGSTANALQVENTATHKLVVQFSGPTGTQINDFCIFQGATGSAFTVAGADSNGNVYLWKIAD